jgi:signal transduction histidine kinase
MLLTRAFWGNRWLMAGGIVSLAMVLCVLVLFSVFLVREIRESRRQQTFIDSVTHELKSPLASIKLCLDTITRTGISEPQRQHLRQMMRNDVDRLTLFVDDILEASRIAHGLRSQLWNTVNILELVSRSVENVRQRHELPAEAITIDVPPNLDITTDPTALETILKNVLDNAVKYSPAPVRVRLTASTTNNGQLEMRISDAGIGVEKKQLKRIFRRFYRAPTDIVYERSGTGLGLYVVAELLRNLGGSVRAESPGLNQGTTVSIRLPLGVAPPEASNA